MYKILGCTKGTMHDLSACHNSSCCKLNRENLIEFIYVGSILLSFIIITESRSLTELTCYCNTLV
jgi:hypothetical protein